MAGEIINFPDMKNIEQEIEKLRTELSMLVIEHDTLRFNDGPNIETAYMLALGGLEYSIFEAQCEMKRLMRKRDLMQMNINRGEKPNVKAIEKELDEEFQSYKEKLDEELHKINKSIERASLPTLSADEEKELKKLYRKIVKKLHPDLNPDATDEQKRLFQNAVIAYQNGDLSTIRMIADISDGADEKKINGNDALFHVKENLEKSIGNMKAKIDKIKSEYPFTLAEFTRDKNKMSARKNELEEILKKYKQAIENYERILDEMMK